MGYVNPFINPESTRKQLELLKKYEIKRVVTEESDYQEEKLLYEMIHVLGDKDKIFISSIDILRLPCIQLGEFLHQLSQKGIELEILTFDEHSNQINSKQYIEFLVELSEYEKYVCRERTVKGLNTAKKKGRIGGRPQISIKTIEKINFLYKNKKHSIREIARECNISVGTVYKYANKIEHEELS